MRAALLILRKDLLVLCRTPVVSVVLVAYPLVIAALIGLAAGYVNSTPRVALVDLDGLPPQLTVVGETFRLEDEIRRAARNVRLVRMDEEEAGRRLRDGRVVAVVTVPRGFTRTLRGLVFSPTLELRIGRGALASRVRQQMQAMAYALNLRLQKAFIAADVAYLNVLQTGGSGVILGNRFSIIGLDGIDRVLATMPHGVKLDAIRKFSRSARTALSFADDAVRASANPVKLVEREEKGRSWVLGAQVQAYAMALTIAFLGILLAAGATAAERDENVIGRLARGLVGRGQLVAAKVGLAATVAVLVGMVVALVFGAVVAAGAVPGGEPWERLPLLAVGLALTGGAIGALGTLLGCLAREARTASLVAILAVLPIVFVGIVPREVVPPAGWVSDALPFAHGVRFFASALFDRDPWAALGREAAWLVGIGLVLGLAARRAVGRLSS